MLIIAFFVPCLLDLINLIISNEVRGETISWSVAKNLVHHANFPPGIRTRFLFAALTLPRAHSK